MLALWPLSDQHGPLSMWHKIVYQRKETTNDKTAKELLSYLGLTHALVRAWMGKHVQISKDSL